MLKHFCKRFFNNSTTLLDKNEYKRTYTQLSNMLSQLKELCNVSQKQQRIDQLSKVMKDPSIWEDEDYYNILLREQNSLTQQVSDFEKIEQEINDCNELYELGLNESISNLNNLLLECEKLQYSLLLSNPNDINNCQLTVYCGSGGFEAQDWALTLFNMYINYCKKNNYIYNIINEIKTDVGIQTSTIEINQEYIYGWLKYEQGVHRRSRVSPYGNAAKSRQTSFSSVQVIPVNKITGITTINNGKKKDIYVDEKDIEWEAMRGHGPGGQHKNTTNSCVRMTHIPTGIVVVCQDERDLYANKERALEHLKLKLIEKNEKEIAKEKQVRYSELEGSTFGSQIRNYVQCGNSLVKDKRSGYEFKNVDKILDGNIDDMLKYNLIYFYNLNKDS